MTDRDERRVIQGIPGLPKWWQNFLCCIILHMLFPLLPLLLELLYSSTISEHSLSLAGAMYVVGIGISSRDRLLFICSLAVCIILAFLFGCLVGRACPIDNIRAYAAIGIAVFFLTHSMERYNRHVVERRPFFEAFEPDLQSDL